MTHVTCRLTAKNRDQLRNPTLGNRVWATFLVGWVGCTIAKVLNFRKDYVNAFKALLDKIWLLQAVAFDFMADLTGTGNRSEAVIKR